MTQPSMESAESPSSRAWPAVPIILPARSSIKKTQSHEPVARRRRRASNALRSGPPAWPSSSLRRRLSGSLRAHDGQTRLHRRDAATPRRKSRERKSRISGRSVMQSLWLQPRNEDSPKFFSSVFSCSSFFSWFLLPVLRFSHSSFSSDSCETIRDDSRRSVLPCCLA